jgi:hypothetical protein
MRRVIRLLRKLLTVNIPVPTYPNIPLAVTILNIGGQSDGYHHGQYEKSTKYFDFPAVKYISHDHYLLLSIQTTE